MKITEPRPSDEIRLQRAWTLCSIVIALAAAFAYSTSRLSLSPVPWPDQAAYFLPSLELFAWPPQWRMHAQAAFEPSYDIANFNTPPGLAVLFGFAHRVGATQIFGATWSMRALSIAALIAFAWQLRSWVFRGLREPRGTSWACTASIAIFLAVLADPVIRWGTLGVRTEIWIALVWLLLLRKLDRFTSRNHNEVLERRDLRAISVLLALAAYTHYAAILLVPPVTVFLLVKAGSTKQRIHRLIRVGLLTSLFLLPWILYAAMNLDAFSEQMTIHFNRLGHGHPYIRSLHSLFHSLFLSDGNAVGYAKFFNSAKLIFWLLIFVSLAQNVFLLANETRARFRAIGAASACLFLLCFYLWVRKPEIWFISLIHLSLWAAVGSTLLRIRSPTGLGSVIALTLLYASISVATQADEWRRTPAEHSWKNYLAWVDCIHDTLRGLPKYPQIEVWQPAAPDVLAELGSREPRLDLTRALDIRERIDQAWKKTVSWDALIFTRQFSHELDDYSGPAREVDQKMLLNRSDVPFGAWALDLLDSSRQLRGASHWKLMTCHVGTFWSTVALHFK